MKRIQFVTSLLLSWFAVSIVSADSPIQPGDRVAIVGNTFADQLRNHGYLETMLLQQSIEKDPVSIRNLGWAGDMLSARDRPTNFPSEESTLMEHKTDAIIACFGMGESFNGRQGLNEFSSELRSFIASHAGKKYNGKSEVRLILVSPIAYEDLGRLTPQVEERNQLLAAYTAAMRDVAAAANVPFVDLYSTSRYLMEEPTGPDLTTNGIHLNSYGYWAISRTFCDQLISRGNAAGNEATATLPGWQLTIDSAARTGRSRGVNIVDVTADESGLSFQVTETSFPNLAPPTDEAIHSQLLLKRDTLVVENLKPGNYRLTVDGKHLVTADKESWTVGVAIDSSPAHKAAKAYRAAVNDKNRQFTYSWKALNQVHIVGERKTSPSGQHLPKEVIKFNQLANERDADLGRGLELKTRLWRLTRVEN